jgi:hypothetical protein
VDFPARQPTAAGGHFMAGLSITEATGDQRPEATGATTSVTTSTAAADAAMAAR